MLSHDTRGLVFLFPSYYSINMFATLVILLFLSVRLCEVSKEVNKLRIKSSNEEEREEVEEDSTNIHQQDINV